MCFKRHHYKRRVKKVLREAKQGVRRPAAVLPTNPVRWKKPIQEYNGENGRKQINLKATWKVDSPELCD